MAFDRAHLHSARNRGTSMVKFLLIIIGVAFTIMAPPNAYAELGDVKIQYLFVNRGNKSLDISVDGAKLIGSIPREASTKQTGRVEWRAVGAFTAGWALFKRRCNFEIRVDGVESDHEVIFADANRFIEVVIDQHNEMKITLLNAPQDFD